MPAQSRHNLQIKGMYTCLEICDPRRTGGTGAPSCSCSRRSSKGHRCVLQLMPQMTNRKFAAGKREMDQKTPCLPAMLAYHWQELPRISFLLWQRRICRDKMCFVTTKLSLWLLFWQAYFCCNKHVCPEKTHLFLCVTKVCLSWQARVCCDKSFVATKIFCHNIILLQQAYFCCNKRCVLLWQKRYLWQLLPMILAGLLPQPSRLMGSGSELELKNFSGPTKTIPVLTFATAIHFQASLVGIMLSHNELCTARSILSCCLWPCYVTILWGGYSPFNAELLSVAMLCYHTVRWVQPINAELLSVAMLLPYCEVGTAHSILSCCLWPFYGVPFARKDLVSIFTTGFRGENGTTEASWLTDYYYQTLAKKQMTLLSKKERKRRKRKEKKKAAWRPS